MRSEMNRVKFDDHVVVQIYHPEDPPNVVQSADNGNSTTVTPIQKSNDRNYCGAFRGCGGEIRQWAVRGCTRINDIISQGIRCCYQFFDIRDSIRYLVIGISAILLGLVVFAGIYVMFDSGSSGGDSTIERGFNTSTSLPMFDSYRVD